MQVNAEIRAKIRKSHRNKAGPRGFFTKACSPCYHTFFPRYNIIFILEILAVKMSRANAVPDPAPTLLDSIFCQTSQSTTIVLTVRKICSLYPLHPHQSAIQLFATTNHTHEHFQLVSQLY
jgi:hypothetical protein